MSPAHTASVGTPYAHGDRRDCTSPATRFATRRQAERDFSNGAGGSRALCTIDRPSDTKAERRRTAARRSIRRIWLATFFGWVGIACNTIDTRAQGRRLCAGTKWVACIVLPAVATIDAVPRWRSFTASASVLYSPSFALFFAQARWLLFRSNAARSGISSYDGLNGDSLSKGPWCSAQPRITPPCAMNMGALRCLTEAACPCEFHSSSLSNSAHTAAKRWVRRRRRRQR